MQAGPARRQEVVGGEGGERERDEGGQVRAAVLGQELLGLVRQGLLPLNSLFLLGAENLQQVVRDVTL
jgi:hypothetical protein